MAEKTMKTLFRVTMSPEGPDKLRGPTISDISLSLGSINLIMRTY